MTVGAILSLVSPEKTKGAVGEIAWPTVLLICGIVTYVSLLEEIGTVDYLGEQVADLGAPLLSALLICSSAPPCRPSHRPPASSGR